MSATDPRRPDSRTLALDGLRGVSCAAIVVLHVWMFDWGSSGKPEKGPLDIAISQLHLAVPLFFVLSGFLIYRPFAAAALDGRSRPHLGRYWLRRAARILPAYWAAVIGSYVLLTVIGHPNTVAASELPRFFFFIQNYSEATRGQLDPPMWTLAVEVTFYALVPVIALLLTARAGSSRARQAAIPAGLLVVGVALEATSALTAWPATVAGSLLTNMAPFAAGMLGAVLVHGRHLGRRPALAIIAGAVLLVLADAVLHGLRLGPAEARMVINHLPGSIGFAAIVATLTASAVRGEFLTRAPLSTIGTLSYGIYLWHFPVIYALRGTQNWPEQLVPALAATCAITVPLAVVSWFALERPALRWAARRTRTPRPPRTPAAARAPRRQAEAAWATAPGRT